MKFLIAAFMTVTLLEACSFNYEDWGVKDPSQVPQTIMTDYTQESFKNGKPVYKYQGKQFATYEALKEWRLSQTSFEEYDSQGKVVSNGFFEHLNLKTDSNNATLDGKVHLWSSRQKAVMDTENLSWQQKQKLLESASSAPVILQTDEGSKLEGYHMALDFRAGTMSMEGSINGEWNSKESTPAPGATPAPSSAPADTASTNLQR